MIITINGEKHERSEATISYEDIASILNEEWLTVVYQSNAGSGILYPGAKTAVVDGLRITAAVTDNA